MQRRTTRAAKAAPRPLAILMALLVLGMVWGQTSTVLAVSDELDASQELRGDDDEADADTAAQGFQATKDGKITRISLWTYSHNPGNNDVDITVDVRRGTPLADHGSLGTTTRRFSNMDTTGAWVDFVFDTPIPVARGTPYYYQVTYSSYVNVRIKLGYKVSSPGSSPYAGGDSWTPTSDRTGWERWDDADFAFRVYLAVNQVPVLDTNAVLTANEGAGTPITNTHLKVTDADGDTITYTLESVPENGDLQVGDSPLNVGATFTQDDIDAGDLKYVHDDSETTSDSFTFTAADGNGGSINNTGFMITINPVNDPPTFNLGADVEVAEDSGAYSQANFLTDANAMEAGQTILSITLSNDNNGLFSAQPTIDGTGKLAFTPAANAYGTATVTVTVRDDGGTANGGQDSATQTFTVTVTPVNDPPSFTPGPDITVDEDAGAQTRVAWATDIDAGPNESTQTVTFTVTSTNNSTSLFSVQPAVDPTGTLTFTPAPDAFGTAMLEVKANDGQAEHNESAPRKFTITIIAVNDPPTAVDDVDFGTWEDSGEILILADLLANDSPGPANESDQTLSITDVANGTGGTVRRDGSAIYFTPAANFHGNATFTYTLSDGAGGTDTATVTVPVSPVADTPTVTNKTIDEDTDATGLVIKRNEVDGAEVTHFQITWAADQPGTLKRNDGTPIANGAFIEVAEGLKGLTFTPNMDANGTFTFTVVAATSAAGNGKSDTISFNVTVNPVNDPPEANDDDLGTKAEDTGPWAFPFATLTANDFDGPETATDERAVKTLTVISVGAATGGAVALDEDRAVVIFTTAEHYNGPAEFTYTVKDSGGATATATARFTITPVNDPPEGADDELPDVAEDTGPWAIPFATLLANDAAGPANEGDQNLTIIGAATTLKGAQIKVEGSDVIFTPPLHYNGEATFTYTLQDDGTTAGSPDPLTAEAHVRFTITPVNDAPVAHDRALSVTVGNTLKDRVSAIDVDQDPVTYALVDAPTLGTVTMNADGSFTYVSSRTGLDTFTYKANDGIIDSNVATVSVQVRGRASAETFVPVLSISAPVTETRERSIVVSGSANPGYQVVVGGTAVQAGSDGRWSATVSLEEGPNVITASHSGLSRSVTVVRDTTPPVITFTASESRTEAESVVLTATANEEGARVTIEGQATTSLTVQLSMGQNRFSATATDRLGNQSTATLSVLRVGKVPPVLRQAGTGEAAEASMLNFSVRIPGESVTEPVQLRILAPTAETGALRLAQDAAQVVGTGDSDVTRQGDATPLSEVTATVTFGYDPALVADPEAVRIYYFDTQWQVWVELGGTVDLGRHTITVQVSHFTTFAALVPSISAPVLAQPPAEVETEKLTVTGAALPETPVTLVINGDSQITVMTDAEGRYSMVGTLSEGRNWVYVKSTGALASREYGVTFLSYTDIGGHWAEETVNRLARLRILSLYPHPLFRPEEQVTRLEFAVMVARVLELTSLNEAPTFTDTDQMAAWALPEVAAAVRAGIIKGMPDGSFAPNAPVTRAEMAIMLTRALGYAGRDISPGEKRFADHAAIPEWALAQVQTVAQYGLITGYPDGSFQPSNGTTRAEAVTMLERLLDQVK